MDTNCKTENKKNMNQKAAPMGFQEKQRFADHEHLEAEPVHAAVSQCDHGAQITSSVRFARALVCPAGKRTTRFVRALTDLRASAVFFVFFCRHHPRGSALKSRLVLNCVGNES